ncbi:RES domain-containing protein [Nitrosospira sp. Nsp18]|nr:RES domain-containing protein [Nitrosospira sp. Nsp18]
MLLDTLKLRLVAIHGDGAQTLRLNLAELAGGDYTYPQALAKAIHDHASEPHGMVYRSRFDDDALAMVLFERAKPHVRIFPSSTPVALLNAKELGDAIRNTVPFILI